MDAWGGIVPEADLVMYSKAGMGGLNGFGERPALLIVDVSNSYIDPRYPYAVVDGAATVQAIRRMLELARARHLPIVFTTSRPWIYPSDRGRWKGSADPILSTPEANEIVVELTPHPDEPVLVKMRASAFFGTELASMLTYHKVDTLIITGCVTSGCVKASVIDASSYNYFVIVPEEAVADRGRLSHKVSLFDMHMKYGDVLPLERVEHYLQAFPVKTTVLAGA